MPRLMKYDDATDLREATREEIEKSLSAAKTDDDGVGAITVEIDGETVKCYVASDIGQDSW